MKLESQGTEDLLASKMLIRAFLEEEAANDGGISVIEEGLDEEEYEAIKETDDSDEPCEEIEVIENEDSLPRFVSCPSISITEPSGELTEDMLDFTNQLPGYQTYETPQLS